MRPYKLDQRERGTVLIIALILLLVMTMLGITALNTTSLEEKMAANTQETSRAFQTAEAGLSNAFGNPNAFVAFQLAPVLGKTGQLGPYISASDWSVRYLGFTNPPIGSLYSATQFSAYHFDMLSNAASRVTNPAVFVGIPYAPSLGAARTSLNQGAFMISRKGN